MAKYSTHCGENSNITWRISISPMDLLKKDAYSGCNVIDVLVILKDIRKVVFSHFSRKDFSTYHIKSALLWSMEKEYGLQRQELIDVTLKNLLLFYSKRHLPDFFNEKINLIQSVPENIAKNIEDLLEDVRLNIDTVIDSCERSKAQFRLNQKAKVAKISRKPCFLRKLLLKLFLVLMLWFPRLSRYVISKCFNYILLKILFGKF